MPHESMKQDGTTFFEVRPEVLPANPMYTIVGGLFLFVLAIVLGSILFGYSGRGAGFWAVCSIIGAGVCFFAAGKDERPADQKMMYRFQVADGVINVNGADISAENIHGITVFNPISNTVSAANPSFVTGVGLAAAMGTSALAGAAVPLAAYARYAKVCYGVRIEAGGVAYMIGGGLDEVAANGLRFEVAKSLGFKVSPV